MPKNTPRILYREGYKYQLNQAYAVQLDHIRPKEGAVKESKGSSKLQTVVGWGLLALGIVVFAVRFQHDGAYAMPGGGNLFGGLAGLILGAVLVWPGKPRGLGWMASPSSKN